jgi:transcriptional regulator with XRE-family HTH domain
LTDDEIGPGERLRRAIFSAAALQGIKCSEVALAAATGVSRNALRRLFAGHEPEGQVLSRIATGLKSTPEALIAAREGRSPDVGLARIANEIHELRETIRSAGGGRRQFQDARVAIDAAREGLEAAPEGDPPSEPVASFRRRKSDT